MIFVWYFAQLFKQKSFLKSSLLASRMKSGLAMLLYAKISSISSYTIKSSQLGKLTNLLASDMGTIEHRIATLFNLFALPFAMIGSTVILIILFNWPGVVGILIFLLVLPVSNYISKKNGTTIQ